MNEYRACVLMPIRVSALLVNRSWVEAKCTILRDKKSTIYVTLFFILLGNLSIGWILLNLNKVVRFEKHQNKLDENFFEYEETFFLHRISI